MKGIFGLFIFILILVAIIVMVIVNFMYRSFRRIREELEEKAYYNEKRKEKKEKNPFGADYFKSSSNKSGNRYSHTQYEFRTSSKNGSGAQAQEQTTTTRKTTTSEGVTIIDGRDVKEKKIFDSDDGEYVEFEEVEK